MIADALRDASEALVDQAVRKAFELGWYARDGGMALPDALHLYDSKMGGPASEAGQ